MFKLDFILVKDETVKESSLIEYLIDEGPTIIKKNI